MKILNEFGIKPTRNYTAAGYDFYVPDIKTSVEDSDFILAAFSKSYKKSIDELKDIINSLVFQISAVFGEDKIIGQEMNVLMLYLCLDSPDIKNSDNKIEDFIDYYLIFDDSGKPGLKLQSFDHIFINSGVHTTFEHGKAGLFVNKSGRGLKGWDVRACLVDEDYTGFVHLSLSYTKIDDYDGVFYVGDKITQMIVLNIADMEPVEELSAEDYLKLTESSKRGSDGFGSSDEKH